MSADEGDAPSRRQKRRILLVPLLRSTAVVALLTTLYYLAPLDRTVGLSTAVGLAAGLLAFGALITWQTMAIIRAEHPRLRAMEALATAVPLFLLLFSATYYLIAKERPSSFSQHLSRTDALYFTVTVFATVGFGDIVATSQTTRVLATVQMIVDLILVGVIAKLIFGAVQLGLERRKGRVP
ncbi:potassium channel family protein [Streptomyces sp. NPDC019890]|uniref:potassium channel family protein n=1 Tax=Streptomyces sp. NPDC019890 TaxID=3365064 RepID=UPI00384DE583